MEFDTEGKWLNTYQLNSDPTRILPLEDELFVFNCRNLPEYISPIDQSLIISDLNNNIQKVYKNYHKRNSRPALVNPFSAFYTYQGNIIFREYGCDTLFKVKKDDLMPYYILSLGNKEIPPDFPIIDGRKFVEIGCRDEYPGKYYLQLIFENTDNLYVNLDNFNDADRMYGFINKHSHTVKIIGKDGFQNDIDGGLPFFPKFVYNDSILVDYVNAFDLRAHVLNGNASEMRRLYGQKYDDLVKLVNSIDDESNPIVVMIKK